MRSAELKRFTTELCSSLLSPALLDQGFKSGVFITADSHALQTGVLDLLTGAVREGGARVARVCARQCCDNDVIERVTATARTQLSGDPDKSTSAQLKELVLDMTHGGTPFVMLIENVDAWTHSREGMRMLRALKAVRDAVNLPASCCGNFLVVGAGETPQISALTQDPVQPFYGAVHLTLQDERTVITSRAFV